MIITKQTNLKYDKVYENKINCYELILSAMNKFPDNKKIQSINNFYEEMGYLSEKQIEYLKTKS